MLERCAMSYRTREILLTFSIFTAALLSSVSAQADKRSALVIGNSAYTALSPTPKAGDSAEAVAAALRRLGFESVTLAKDLGREQFADTLRAFAREAATSDWAVVYYAGHG